MTTDYSKAQRQSRSRRVVSMLSTSENEFGRMKEGRAVAIALVEILREMRQEPGRERISPLGSKQRFANCLVENRRERIEIERFKCLTFDEPQPHQIALNR